MPTNSFVYTWNSAFLSQPADTEDESLGALRIRGTKGAVGERLAVDHSLNGDVYDGMHTIVELRVQSTDGTAQAGQGNLYTKTFNSNVELFYQDSSGNVLQISQNGQLGLPAVIPSGTNMVFVQATVPTGWTLNTSLNDQVLRVVNSGPSGGQTGGSWEITGGSVGGTSLTAAQVPNISFPERNYNISGGTNSGFGSGGDSEIYWNYVTISQTSGGGGQPHSHSFTNDSSWRPAYVNVLIGTKN